MRHLPCQAWRYRITINDNISFSNSKGKISTVSTYSVLARKLPRGGFWELPFEFPQVVLARTGRSRSVGLTRLMISFAIEGVKNGSGLKVLTVAFDLPCLTNLVSRASPFYFRPVTVEMLFEEYISFWIKTLQIVGV
jgi:hypothetical protein